MNAEHVSKAQSLCLDRISSLPRNIIETILCLVPIQEAGRTSILSREWRHYWTTIPKLMFSLPVTLRMSTDLSVSVSNQTYDIASARKKMDERCKLFYAIYQVLLFHQGPILEFTLEMGAGKGCFEIDQVIHYLSRKNTVKKFTLKGGSMDGKLYNVPLSIFSLHQLTNLRLGFCDFDHQPTFNGFGRLTSLYLDYVNMSSKTLRHLLSNCPLLKCFTLLIYENNILEYREESDIIELFECLPVIENLTMMGSVTECFFVEQPLPQELPTSLIHLKYFCFEEIDLRDHDTLPLLALLIRCAPNLEKIKIEIYSYDPYDYENPSVEEEYPGLWLEHLKELEVMSLPGLSYEFEFVNFILARSPVLKKVNIMLLDGVTKDEELAMLRILLRAPRASPVAEVIVSPWFNNCAV